MLLAQPKFSSQHFCPWAKCRFRCGEGTGFILLRLWFIVAKVSISARNDAVCQKVPGSVSKNERISENICKIPSTWTWNIICNKPRSFMRSARFYNANTVLSKYYLDLQGPRWTDVVVTHMPNSSLEILNVIFHRTVAWATRNLLILVRTRQFFLFAGSLGSEFSQNVKSLWVMITYLCWLGTKWFYRCLLKMGPEMMDDIVDRSNTMLKEKGQANLRWEAPMCPRDNSVRGLRFTKVARWMLVNLTHTDFEQRHGTQKIKSSLYARTWAI